MPSALITGITGQDGLYLAEFLHGKDYQVHGLVRGLDHPRRALVEEVAPGLVLHDGDLTRPASLRAALEASGPDEVYNLGAVSGVGRSWDEARLTSDVNATGALNMLEALREHCGSDPRRVRYYQASSSEMFGRVTTAPQDEDTPLWPRSPYAVAKTFAHHLTLDYRDAYGLHASCGIAYNHESPRRSLEFVTRKISHAVARISLGLQDELVLGTLEAQRDWGFAGDYVEAKWRMLQQDEPGDYVLATGETHSIREFVEAAFRSVGIADWRRYVHQDERFMRPVEVQSLVGNPRRAREVLGWKPRVGFLDLVAMMVEADVALARAES